MNNLKQISLFAFLMFWGVTSCTSESDVTDAINGTGVNVTLSIQSNNKIETRVGGIAPLDGESIITNVCLLMYKQGDSDNARPVFFFNEKNISVNDVWSHNFNSRDFRHLDASITYDVFVLASVVASDKIVVPTSSTTKAELKALNDYRCYCGESKISFSGIASFKKDVTTELNIDLTRTVARLDIFLLSFPAGGVVKDVWMDNVHSYTPFFKDGTQKEGRKTLSKSDSEINDVISLYIFGNDGSNQSEEQLYLCFNFLNADGTFTTYRTPIAQVIERNKIYKIGATLLPDKQLHLTIGTPLLWEAGSESVAPPSSDVNPEPEANSYIVKPGSKSVFIPVSQINKANAYKNTIPALGDADELTAELVWTDVKGEKSGKSIACDAAIQEINVLGKGKNTLLMVTSGDKVGNAIVAVKDASGIRWSWHIWVTDYDPNIAEGQGTFNGYTFMKRNMGALNETYGDPDSRGNYYQWGRKDPFPGTASWAANEGDPYKWRKNVYDVNGDLIPTSSQITVAGVNNFTIEKSIRNPQMIYMPTGVTYWTSETQENMWGGALGANKSVYDPCPSGWRVPVKAAFSAFNTTNLKPVSGNDYGLLHSDVGFFPFGGMGQDDSAAQWYPTITGFYISADWYNIGNCYQLYIQNGNIQIARTDRQERLYSLRCVKDWNN